jgi:hypothetical protein
MINGLCISTGEKLKIHWSENFQELPARSLKSKLQTLNTDMNTRCTYKFTSRLREKTVYFLKNYRYNNE